jgi:hypothetical protein
MPLREGRSITTALRMSLAILASVVLLWCIVHRLFLGGIPPWLDFATYGGGLVAALYLVAVGRRPESREDGQSE